VILDNKEGGSVLPEPAKQVAALCWRKRKNKLEVLLVTSRETKRWVIPKGWPVQGLMDYNAARREAFEEAGVQGRVKTKAVASYTYDKRRSGGSIPVTVTVYTMRVSRILTVWPEQRQRKRQWFTPQEAAHQVQEHGLKQLLLAA
jgi:8-oxo-dGTP pyrophosphatase MutT (NUDIX family)